jgi:fatty-acid peroxygenase
MREVLMQFDSTLNIIRDPYGFISSTAKALDTDVFETRLLLEKMICMTGKQAAAVFTDQDLFIRRGAAPEFLRSTLFGNDGVQTLDDEAHLHRKTLFMSLLGPESLYHLRSIMNDWLEIYAESWTFKKEVILYEEFQEILTRSVCAWAGVELKEEEVKLRTKQLASLFDAAGNSGHLKARRARKNAESWIMSLVNEVRDDVLLIPRDSPFEKFAFFQDLNGEPLPARVAAVEILNVLRPTVAVSLYFVFCIHALHMHPESRHRLRAQELGYLDNFINEVRRFYPFIPAIMAKVKTSFIWNDIEFLKGTRVLLDIYGTNHDERDWYRPMEFHPDRFKVWNGSLYNFIPQGVGDHYVDHRCPGELITIELMRSLVEFFSYRISYHVPKQNLTLSMARLPAAPRSLMKINKVNRLTLYVEHPLL